MAFSGFNEFKDSFKLLNTMFEDVQKRQNDSAAQVNLELRQFDELKANKS